MKAFGNTVSGKINALDVIEEQLAKNVEVRKKQLKWMATHKYFGQTVSDV